MPHSSRSAADRSHEPANANACTFSLVCIHLRWARRWVFNTTSDRFFFHRIAATCSGFSPFQFPFGFHFSVSHGTCNTLWRLSPVLFRYQQRQLYFCSPVSLYRPHVLYHLLSNSVLTLYAFCTLSPFLSGRYGLIRL